MLRKARTVFIILLVICMMLAPAVQAANVTEDQVRQRISACRYHGKNIDNCKEFARDIFRAVFGTNLPSTGNFVSGNGKAYEYAKSNAVRSIGQLIGKNYDEAHLRELCLKAKIGDVLQVSKKWGSGAHTYIILSSSNEGIYVFDANFKGGKSRYNDFMSYQEVINSHPYGCTLYRATNYDVNTSDETMLDYRKYGFNHYFYANYYPDLKEAFGYNEEALWNHWCQYGIYEGRISSPLFNVVYYLANNKDLSDAFGSTNHAAAYQHFLTYGYKEFRPVSPIVDLSYYFDTHSDVASICGREGMYIHLCENGMFEGRATSSNFNARSYSDRYSDLVAVYGKSDYTLYFQHYIVHGQYENRNGK